MMAAPQVAHVVLSLGAGGTERLVIEICKRLPSITAVVCCLDEPGAWATELTTRGINVVSLSRQPGFHPSLGWRIARLAREQRASVLHCHHYSPFVYGRIAALASTHLRVVFTEHGRLSDGQPSRKRRLVNPVLGRLAGDIYAVSADLRRHMLAEGFPAERVSVIHNGIDPGSVPTPADRDRARRLLGVSSRALLVGTVARFDPVKDLTTLLDAFVALRSTVPHAELLLVGDGSERSRLEQRAIDAGVQGAVHFTGYRADARRLLPALDIYVNSSTTEGISLTILEAMAAALPIVATHVGGNPEVVVAGDTGVLVPARAIDPLAAALCGLALAPERREALGIAGRRRLTRYFTIDRMVDAYRHVYCGAEVA
jgi:glycosyltransferase involved in cell wall biosynthesis